MQIQCDCGQVRAEIKHFPKDMPGRLACYCDDCQMYLMHLQRTDLFVDAAGGTEIVPVYPAHLALTQGADKLECLRLSPNGMFRWWASCCKTPIANLRPNFPWIGVFARAYSVQDPELLPRTFGPRRSAILGKFARGPKPKDAAETMNFKAFWSVFPFLLKGLLTGKAKGSAFFKGDGQTPLKTPVILDRQVRENLRAEFAKLERHDQKRAQ